MDTQFDWDEDKAKANLRKHRVSFEEASAVFDDPLAYIFGDEEHSETEQREIIIGQSARRRLLLVYFTERALNLIRLISARLANRQERHSYEERELPED